MLRSRVVTALSSSITRRSIPRDDAQTQLRSNENVTVERDQTEARLKEMLLAEGVDVERPDPLMTWGVFATFGSEEIVGVEPDDDGFLFWWGVHGSGEPFRVGFLRQFSFYSDDDEYDHMEQLRCTFEFESTTQLRAFGNGDDWWFRSEPRRTLSDWIAHVEAMPSFGVVRERVAPADGYFEQGRI
jgi:hypothetical protein